MIQRLKGTRDILQEEIVIWQYVEKLAKECFENYGYSEVRIPCIEKAELFQRGVGETTDVVEKEMYIFKDKGDRQIALRPEGTAGFVRAYLENGLSSKPSPTKVYYMMPMYRYENVQKGRQREFNQIGAELLGTKSYLADLELIEMINDYINMLNIKNIELRINSIGCSECRKNYQKALKEYITANIDEYCDTCKERLDRNPMRILDCKEKRDTELNKKAPIILDYLCDECKEHFENLKNGLTKANIDFIVDPYIVRGLDYYTKTVFEFVSKIDGLTVFGGGRYDNLVEELGGASTPAIGFSTGEERLISLFKEDNKEKIENLQKAPALFIASIGEEAKLYAMELVRKLRQNNVYAETDISDRSIKAQFKYADKKQAKYVITIGDEELNTNKANIKNMETGEVKDINLQNVSEIIDKLS